jgi:methylmalonyl-CoA mutase
LTKIELNLFSMPNHAIHDLLKQSFPISNKDDWSAVASQEIQGKNPFETLAWKMEGEIKFFPYYDNKERKNFDYLRNFEVPPCLNTHTGPRSWQCLPKITVIDVDQANAVALNHLANGADGLLFDLRQVNVVDVNRLLNNIDWPFCNVSFLVMASSKIIQPIIQYIQKKNYNPAILSGTLFWESMPQDAFTDIQAASSLMEFYALGVYMHPSSPVKEISEALTKATTLMDVLTNKGVEKEIVWRNISLSFSAGPDFFLEIAKLKALRVLWYQLAHAFELRNYRHTDIQIHVRSEAWIDDKFQPLGNMLRSTSAALAAVMGGGDSITIAAEDEDNIMMNRIARNVSNILREEAHLNKVSDPAAGAYAIENMVHEIAQAAWTDFQHQMKSS